MVNITKTAEPIIKPEVHIDENVKLELLQSVQEESQVIVHCTYKGTLFYDRIRIWESTFLIAKNADHRSNLMHAHNIAFYPTWMSVPPGKIANFTLVFSALPKDCVEFDLMEMIPESGGFEFHDIKRNQTDIYHIKF
jgi:hypothetical protein